MNLFLKIIWASQIIVFSACSQQIEPAPTPPTKIYNFQQCSMFGGKILKTYPAKCRTQTGETFIQDMVPANAVICSDFCGDQTCQEIVCQGSGCPCAESKDRCPEDCSK